MSKDKKCRDTVILQQALDLLRDADHLLFRADEAVASTSKVLRLYEVREKLQKQLQFLEAEVLLSLRKDASGPERIR